MCCDYSEEETRKFRRKHRGRKTVRVWKMLRSRIHSEDELRSSIYDYSWKIGINASSRSHFPNNGRLTSSEKHMGFINEGFHVYLHPVRCGSAFRQVYLSAKLADLVGVDGKGDEAVFSHLTLSRFSYKEAMGIRPLSKR